MILLLLILLLTFPGTAQAASHFACAGLSSTSEGKSHRPAAKLARALSDGPLTALVLFAHFRGEHPEGTPAPAWSDGLFDSDRPGSFSHFYETMSFGRFRPEGAIAQLRYASNNTVSSYVNNDSSEEGDFGRFALEILGQADRDVDFSRFDNDGPDGLPDSGDDDGIVDAVFINTSSIPSNFLLGNATGIARLGFDDPFITNDLGRNGSFIRILPSQGTIQLGRTFAEAAGVMCHEFGHLLGLPDLFNRRFFSTSGDPESDSAGIGAWGLMGWGATGWNGNDGPNPFSAWSRATLGWAQVEEPSQAVEDIELTDVARSGRIYRIQVDDDESFLLAYRRRDGTYYDRNMPGEGLMIWHAGFIGHPLPRFILEVESADGRWNDAGFPRGEEARPHDGEDNLGFWAHETDYRERHAGNLGDATDPFDGARFNAFTPDTNPSSLTYDSLELVRIENIRIEDGLARARVQVAPAEVEVSFMDVLDMDGDKALSFGETIQLRPKLVNQGGVVVEALRVRLNADSELLDVIQGETEYGRLTPGRAVSQAPEELLSVRLARKPDSTQTIKLSLDLLVDDNVVGRHDFAIEVVKAYRVSGRVTFAEGLSGPRQQLDLVGSGNTRIIVETDGEGFYAAEVPPGSYDIYVNLHRRHGLGAIASTRLIRGDTNLNFTMRPAYAVRGRVVDEANNPVIGAVVAANSLFGARTKIDGSFAMELAQGQYNFRVEKSSADPQRSFPRQFFDVRVDGETEVEFRLKSGVRITVEVVDAEGNRVRPSNVSVFGSASYESTEIDTAGRTELLVPPGIYSMDAGDLPSPFWSAGLFPVRLTTDTTLHILAERGAAIAGRLADDSLTPFSSGQLHFLPLSQRQRIVPGVAADGSYSASMPPGRYQAYFVSSDLLSSPAQSLGSVEVTDGATLDFHLDPGVRLRGQLIDSEGIGIAGIEVQAFSPSGQMAARAQTGAGGLFDISLRRGEYEWAAYLPGPEPAITGSLSPPGQNAAFWNLGSGLVDPLEGVRLQRLGGALLAGRVFDDTDQPVAGALVMLTLDPLDPAVVFQSHLLDTYDLYKQGETLISAVGTDAEGRFRIEAPPGRYRLVVLPSLAGGLGIAAGEIVLPGTEQLDIALPPHGTLFQVYGNITYEPGWPRSQVSMRFYDEQHRVVLAHTNSPFSAGYQLKMPRGEYQVRVALIAPTGGILKEYDMGKVRIEGEKRWDIDLDRAPTVVLDRPQADTNPYALDQNFPNPFNPATLISYRIPSEAYVKLTVYDVLGRKVRQLINERPQGGTYQVRWDGRDGTGREVSSGVYLYRLVAKTENGVWTQSRKLVLVR